MAFETSAKSILLTISKLLSGIGCHVNVQSGTRAQDSELHGRLAANVYP